MIDGLARHGAAGAAGTALSATVLARTGPDAAVTGCLVCLMPRMDRKNVPRTTWQLTISAVTEGIIIRSECS